MKLASLQAHQQCRKADRLLVAGKYEEAISCHGKAAGKFSDTDTESVAIVLLLRIAALKGELRRKMNLGVNNTCTESTILWDMFSC